MIIELLNNCSSRLVTDSTTQFMLKFDSTSGLFTIAESNAFKQVAHIVLQLRPANDTVLKTYLASRLSLSLSQSQEKSKDIEILSNNLVSSRSAHMEVSKENDQLK